MHEFRYLNYYTKYSCSGSIHKKMGVEICFSTVFKNVKDDSSIHYLIIINKGTSLAASKYRSNACLFQRKDIKNHITQLKSLYPLKSRVTSKENTFEIQLDLKKVPANFHKYALTWIRYLYEYPYNVLMVDAYKLKKEPRFRFESISNLFNLVLGCYCSYIREVHQVPHNCISERLTRKALKSRIKEYACLNSIYDRAYEKEDNNLIPYVMDNYNIYDLEYWTDEKLFDIRKNIYLRVYNYIKK